MSTTHALTAVPAALLQTPGYVTGPTPERITAAVAALVALAGLVVSLYALRRAGRGALPALLLAVSGAVAGVVVVVTADGGPGTGNGIVGGYLAVAVGVPALFLARKALARARRTP